MKSRFLLIFGSMQDIISILKLWSLLIFPGVGFLIGKILHLAICLFMGWLHHPSIEIWLSHLFTMIFLIGTLNNVIYTPQEGSDPRDKAFFICFNYLGLFGLILGLCP